MFEIGRLTRLHLGREGESNARPIEIDMTDWLTEWPGAAVGLLLMRPGEDTFYAAKTRTEDGVMRYVPTRADLEIPGDGMAQIVLTGEGDVELRSRVVKTEVEASLPGSAAGTPEEPMQPFVGQVIDAAARAEKAAKDAEEHKLDGVSPIVETSKAGKVTTITITDAEGVKTATINDGEDGKDGDDGVSPVVTTSKSGKVTTIKITDAEGVKTATVTDGEDGKDGEDGDDGKAATVRIGTVTTLEPGSMATVTNSGTTTDAVLNFGIPRGADGKDGENGSGTNAPAGITQHASGAMVHVKDGAESPAVEVVTEFAPTAEGVASAKLTRTGRNLVSHLDYTKTQGHGATVITEDVIDVTKQGAYDYGKIPVRIKAGVTYTLVIDWEVYGRDEGATGETVCTYRIDNLQTTASQGRVSSNTTRRYLKVYTATEDVDANILWYPNFGSAAKACSRSRVMLLVGEYTEETAPAFEPCRKQVLTATLPETVYGGELDWTSGQLTITHGADGAELATPRTAQIAPQALDMLNGENCVWSDAGNTALTYNADIKLYIDNAIASITAAEGVAF